MNDRYQPRHHWRRTKLDENDTPTGLDRTGFDGAEYIGRIRKELHGPTEGKY